ncbi:MAG: glycoside hydrolase family 92 protein [Flavobacterium sp.]|nr:glycoside hydrolase family 92 protein [Pedobacter sp.]
MILINKIEMKKFLSVITFLVFSFSLVYAQTATKQPVDYVDNRIGVLDKFSNCVIGPQLPYGSISPSPQTKEGEDDGYNPSEPIRGFGQIQQSGTGWGTNGQIFLSPQIGLATGEDNHDSPKSNEKATPYEYGVTLDRYNIDVKFTPSYHSAIYQFKFPKSDNSNILLDITHNIPLDIRPKIKGSLLAGEVHFDDESHQKFSGYGKYVGGFGGGAYTIYFAGEVNKKPKQVGTWINGNVNLHATQQSLKETNDRVGAFLNFSTQENESISLKVAISFKSIEQAREWLNQEIPKFDYEKTKLLARETWNNSLKKIEVEGGEEKDKAIFYTALYHQQLMPRNRTNDTQAFAKDVPMWDDHFAIWDTWRTAYPLHNLLDQEMVAGTVNSFIARFKKYGVVRDAFINGNDMYNEQGGNNIDNVIAEAYLKGVKGVDWEEAYKVLKYDADHQRLGSYTWNQDSTQKVYKELGWIPAGIMSCSMTLEYAYNDYCIAQVAKGLGKVDDYKKYFERSKQWVNLWNKNAKSDGFSGFIMPKTPKGDFVEIDLKAYPGSWQNYFYEASSWNYSFFAPHQFKELVKMNGGKEEFVKKLEYGFKNKLIMYSNEPAFLAVHEFIYADRPDLTSYWVRDLMSKYFTLKGYPGNDDSGAMSSWYVFSAMGFFPNAGQDIYYLTGPLFKSIKINLSNGKQVSITAPKASAKNIYIQSVKINGKRNKSMIFNHQLIANGGTIEFDMGPEPIKN